MDFIVTDQVKAEDRAEIQAGLFAYNEKLMSQAFAKDLGVYLEDEEGKKLAGLLGYTHGEWLHVSILWVGPSARKKGIGSRLLQKAEDTARARGCKFCMLDTFDFQAPEFYNKYGYEEIFHIQEHPATGNHYYMKKEL